MQCICKPWRGYHLTECPCQAAYESLRAAELAECELTDAEVEATAQELVSKG